MNKLLSNSAKAFVVSGLTAISFFILLLVFTYNGDTSLVMMIQSKQPVCGEMHVYQNGTDEMVRAVPFHCKSNLHQTIKLSLPIVLGMPEKYELQLEGSPHNNVSIAYILIKKRGFRPLNIALDKLEVEGFKRYSLSNVLLLKTQNENVIVSFNHPTQSFCIDWVLLTAYLFLSLIVFFAFFYSIDYLKNAKFSMFSMVSAICFSIVIGLAMALSLKAGFNASPDERDHFMAAEYYKTNSITPQKYTESGVHTYNALWHYSRVYQKGVHYLAAGKISNLFDHHVQSYQSVRFFGILLLVLFLFLIIRFPKYSIILLPFLLTPQTWYLYSYINDESLPLFLSFFLLIFSEANKKHLASNKWNQKKWMTVILTGFAFGLLLLSKKSYWAFALFYLFYLFLLPVEFNEQLKSSLLKSFNQIKVPAIILLVAFSVFATRHLTVEIKDKSALSETTETFYQHSKKMKENHMAKGVSGMARYGSYVEMLKKWLPVSYSSFCGVYGFMKFKAGEHYFKLVFWIHLLLLASLMVVVFIKNNRELWFWTIVAGAFIVLMVFLSSYVYSFRYDYQAQGRYLFPVLPVIGLLFYKIGLKSRKSFLLPFLTVLFLMSLYSYILVGYVAL